MVDSLLVASYALAMPCLVLKNVSTLHTRYAASGTMLCLVRI